MFRLERSWLTGTVVGMDVTEACAAVGDDGVLDEGFREVAGLGKVDLPTHDLAGEDIQHHLKVEVELAPL